MTIQEFLIERKQRLLLAERRAKGKAWISINAQIQTIDAMLGFFTTKQMEEDMGKLRLTLDKQATPMDDIKPRQENAELTEALIELANELKPGQKYALNNLPEDTKVRSVSAKIYALRTAGKLPKSIYPATRTVKEDGKQKSVVFMVRKKGE